MVVPVAAAAARAGVTAVRGGAKKGAVAKTKGSGVQNARLVAAANDNGGYSRAARTAYRGRRDRDDAPEEAYANDNGPAAFAKPRTSVPSIPRTKQGTLSSSRSRVPNIGGTSLSLKRIAKAVRASWTIAAFLMPFYIVQFVTAILLIVGAAAEYAGEQFLWGLGAYFVPGEELFGFGFVATPAIGFLFMLTAMLLYTLQGVAWWRSGGIGTFIGCLILYCVPVFNLFPWVVAWLLLVVRAQK